jgi:hypothetical protein
MLLKYRELSGDDGWPPGYLLDREELTAKDAKEMRGVFNHETHEITRKHAPLIDADIR